MILMLDTNMVIYLKKRKPVEVIRKLESFEPEALGISSITYFELQYGAFKSKAPEKNREALVKLISPFEIAEFETAAAERAGEIRAFLEKKGQVIGAYDMLIAGHALALNVPLVTNNEEEFRRVEPLGLTVVNWVDTP